MYASHPSFLDNSPLSIRIQGTAIFGRAHNFTGILIELTGQDAIDVTNPTEVAILKTLIWFLSVDCSHLTCINAIF